MEFPEKILFPQKTIFKKGSASLIGEESLEFGLRGLIVHSQSLRLGGRIEKVLSQFPEEAKVVPFCHKTGEPTLDEIEEVIDRAKEISSLWIIGIGGGSVLDLAKASAGLINARKKPIFYQKGEKLEKKGIPFIAVPTTPGTGAEATPNAVIINKEEKNKLSIRDDSFLARKVILDVELLEGLLPERMSYSAMDAFVQGYESFISKGASWFSSTLAAKSIELINKNILPAYKTAKEENLSSLLLGSYIGGIAFTSSRLGVIHGIAHPLGALYNLPHGLICASCLIPSLKLNRKAMGEKYKILSSIVGMDFLERVELLLSCLNITSPFKNKAIIEKEKIIEETLKSGSTMANPKKIERKDIEFIFEEIF